MSSTAHPSWNFLKKNVNSRSGVFATLRMKSTEEQAVLIESAEQLCSALLDEVHGDVLAVNNEAYLKRVSSLEKNLASNSTHTATVGLMLSGTKVDNLLIGGPAMECGHVQKGDRILKVDGQAVDGNNVDTMLLGNDVPGSLVKLIVAKGDTGAEEEVVIHRMATAKIADKRRMFELFSEIKDSYLKHKNDGGGLFGGMKSIVPTGSDIGTLVDEALHLWTQIQMKEVAHQNERVTNVSKLQASSSELLNQMRETLLRLHSWHDRDLAFYADQDKRHSEEKKAAVEKEEELSHKVIELERLLAESRQQADEQARQLTLAASERDTALADAAASKASLAKEHDARAMAEHERDELAALLAKLREQLKSMTDKLHDLEAERDSLKRENAKLKDELAKANERVATLEGQLDALKAKLKAALLSGAQELEDALSALRAKLKATQDALHDAEEARDVATANATAATKRVAQAEQGLVAATAELEDLRKLVATLRVQIAAKTAEAEAATSERDRAKAELVVTASRLAKESAEKAIWGQERDVAVREHHPCADIIADLKRKLAEPAPALVAAPLRRAGVGMLLHKDEETGTIVCERLTPGGAAFDDGRILPGDLLHSVDGVKVNDMAQVPLLIAGDEGTEIILEMERSATGVVTYYTLRRKVVVNMGSTIAVPDARAHSHAQEGRHTGGVTPR